MKAEIIRLPNHGTGDVEVTFAMFRARQKTTGLSPGHDFKDGIRIFTDWYIKNREK
jgi:hypothetical protein